MACTDKGRVLYKIAGGLSIGIQSLRWDWIVTPIARGSADVVVLHVSRKQIVEDGLGCCDLEIGVNFALAN